VLDETTRRPAPAGWRHVELENGVLLRELALDDAAGVLSVHGDSRVYTLDPHEIHRDLAHSSGFIAPMIVHWRRHGFGYWTVLVPRDWWPEGVPGDLPGDSPGCTPAWAASTTTRSRACPC